MMVVIDDDDRVNCSAAERRKQVHRPVVLARDYWRRNVAADGGAGLGQLPQSDCTDKPLVSILYGDGPDIVSEKQRARGLAAVVLMDADDVARHDVPAQDVRCRPNCRLQFHLAQHPIKIFPADVKRFVQRLERGIDIRAGKADPAIGGRINGRVHICGRSDDVRVVASGQLVKQDPESHQQARVERDGHQREQEAPARHDRAAKHCRQRSGAAGRMQAARKGHRRDRDPHGNTGCDQRIRHEHS
ncbi:hypothetical protein D9M68_413630 [compost metagenome]